jgi:hypothetical protein
MNKKQQLATGFLALMIVGSVAFMPVGAETKTTSATASAAHPQSTQVVATLNSPELPQDQVRDLTYN